MLNKEHILFFLVTAVLVGTVGCGNSGLATVQGIVTLDGTPLPTGSVLFIPSAGGTQAYATINESGEYAVYTGRDQGLRPGEYNVTVVARKKPVTEKTELGGPAASGEAITPRWYASKATSGLTFQVEPGSNNIDLVLTSQPPAGWQDPSQQARR